MLVCYYFVEEFFKIYVQKWSLVCVCVCVCVCVISLVFENHRNLEAVFSLVLFGRVCEGLVISSVHCSVMSNSLQPRSMPDLPVLHQLPKLVQTHVHWIGDAIQPSRPLSSPSPPAFYFFQPSGSFPVSSSHQVAKLLELQHQSFNRHSRLISFTKWQKDKQAFWGLL